MMNPKYVGALALFATAAFAGSAAAAPTVLRASHQFPGGKGDVRDDMVQMVAKEAKAANVDLDVQVYPGASLFKPNQQWNAMVDGQLDISLFPLDYASGKVPTFSATLTTLPPRGAGKSIVALSVSSVTIGSSGAIRSPAFTCTSMTSTALKSPRSGIRTSTVLTEWPRSAARDSRAPPRAAS